MFKYSSEDIEFINKSGFKSFSFWLGTWFGLGLMRPAPGTWGTIGALPLAMLIFLPFGIKGLIIATIWVAYVGLKISDRLNTLTGVHDSKMIVIDEVAGVMIALCFAATDGTITALDALIAFLLFRFFDILKPWPINWMDQNIKGGLGVMVDDIVAGFFAGIVLIGIYTWIL